MNLINNLNKKEIVKKLFVAALSLLLAFLLVKSFGYPMKKHYWLIMFLVLLVARKTLFGSWLIVVAGVVAAIYCYTGIMFGKPSIGVVASLVETDALEATEYISMISFEYIMLSFLILILVAVYFNLRDKQKRTRRSTFIWVVALLVLMLLSRSVNGRFFYDSFRAYNNYYKENVRLLEGRDKQPAWSIVEVDKKYKTYVLVIGESVRKDYLSLYGYPIKTTPFLDQANGVFIDGFIASAPNTATSLPRMFSLTKDSGLKVDPIHNVVTMAESAGIETHWISNQGFLGKTDTAISKIAIWSKDKVFLKGSGEYYFKNSDDFELLPHVQEILQSNNEGKDKIIFLHMMGSHPYTCDRLHDYKITTTTNYGEAFDCYLASIQKTDLFLQRIYQMLQASNSSFSMLYLSDHGMTVEQSNSFIGGLGDVLISTGYEYKQNYDAPLFVLSSDDIQHKRINKVLSGYNFIDLFAQWIGVKTLQTNSSYSLDNYPENHNPIVFNWRNMVKYKELKIQDTLYPNF